MAELLVLQGQLVNGGQIQRIDLESNFQNGSFLIGRSSKAQLQPRSAWISREHCLLERRSGSIFAVDMSLNGTTLNGVVIGKGRTSRPLRDGDLLGIGPLVFQICMPAAGRHAEDGTQLLPLED